MKFDVGEELAKLRERPDWDTYFLNIAVAVAARADCSRAQVGCVIVKDHRIVSGGYNGTPSGDPRSCLKGDCPRASRPEGAPKTDYGDCISLHAEQNAVAYCNRSESVGATIYVTHPPCDMCAKLIAAAGIVRTVVLEAPDAGVV